MIEFEAIECENLWSGSNWFVTNEDELAHMIARVAIGQSEHVLKVLQGTQCIDYAPTRNVFEGAKHLLTARDERSPWHRDGWLFQVISWLAANIQNPSSLKSPPHMIHAHKGFDGLHLCFDEEKQNIVSVTLCEEKATENPRKMITSEVWPEFRSIEAGTRDNELVAEITSLLKVDGHINPMGVAHEIFWKRARAYRISITTGAKENSDAGREALFRGYEKVTPGEDSGKRRAETFYQNDLREWMSSLATKAILAAEEMTNENV